MTLRELRMEDVMKLKEIHKKFYEHEFEFPDFFNGFLCAFACVDDEENIITAGGVRTIVESVLVTDKSFSTRKRRNALYSILGASDYVARRMEYDQLHCFVQDDKWMKCLNKIGFVPTKGRSLVLGLK
jgi:hypothetical protein